MSAEPEKTRQDEPTHAKVMEERLVSDVRVMLEAWLAAGKPRKR